GHAGTRERQKGERDRSARERRGDFAAGLHDRDEQGEEERRKSGVEAEALWLAEETSAEDADRGRTDPARIEQESGGDEDPAVDPAPASLGDGPGFVHDQLRFEETSGTGPLERGRDRDADREVASVEQ